MKSVFTPLRSFQNFAISLLLALGSVSTARAQVFTLPQLPNTSTVQQLSNVLSSALMARTVEPPSEPGRFGFGLGVVASAVSTAQIASLLGAAPLPVLPFGNLYVTLYAPLGITLDVAGLPPLTLASTRFFNIGGNLRWTVSRIIGDWFPVNLAANLSFTSSTLNYSQVLNSVNINVSAASTQFGLDAVVSKQFLFFEPYLALGVTNQSTTIGYTGSQPLFAFTTSTSIPVSNLSFHARGGFQMKFVVFVVGGEYEYAYGNHGGAAKIGFKI